MTIAQSRETAFEPRERAIAERGIQVERREIEVETREEAIVARKTEVEEREVTLEGRETEVEDIDRAIDRAELRQEALNIGIALAVAAFAVRKADINTQEKAIAVCRTAVAAESLAGTVASTTNSTLEITYLDSMPARKLLTSSA
ncbi:hypothetical protein GGI17_005757 [Coemansia sp. S146]|nr:hypothetical protein GGI17_005757 [Coemansia sp. S146]